MSEAAVVAHEDVPNYYGHHATNEDEAVQYLTRFLDSVPEGTIPTYLAVDNPENTANILRDYKPVTRSSYVNRIGRVASMGNNVLAKDVVSMLVNLPPYIRNYYICTPSPLDERIGNFDTIEARETYWQKLGIEPFDSQAQLEASGYPPGSQDTRPPNALNQLDHAGYLFMQWILNMTPKVNARPNSFYINAAMEAMPFLTLRLLCKLLIPDDLFARQSKTCMSSIISLLTGMIILPEYDPTVNMRSFVRLNIFTSAQASAIVAKFFRSRFAYPGSEFTFLGNDYSTLLSSTLQPIFDDCVRALTFSGVPGNPLPVERSEEFLGFLEYIGMDPKIYNFDPRTIKLVNMMPDVVGYLVRKHYGLVPTPILFAADAEDLAHFAANQISPDLLQQTIMKCYTDREVINAFLPGFNPEAGILKHKRVIHFRSRRLFITHFSKMYTAGLYWKLTDRNTACYNDNDIDIIEAVPRGELRAQATQWELTDDPILIYGPVTIEGSRTRCFRVSELEGVFDNTEYGFEFLNPDWRAPEAGQDVSPVIDPLTMKPAERTFSIRDIDKLRVELGGRTRLARVSRIAGLRAKPKVVELLTKIDQGLAELSGFNNFTNDTKLLYAQHPEWNEGLVDYFSWLLEVAMWLRYWKGPGTPYPAIWHHGHSAICTALERDEHASIELSIHGMFIQHIENTLPELAKYLATVPYLHYDWRTGVATKPIPEVAIQIMETNLIEGVIDKVQAGEFCMNQASDLTSGTATYFLTQVLGFGFEQLSDLIINVIRKFQDYEQIAISSRQRTLETAPDVEFREEKLVGIEQHKNVLLVNNMDFEQEPLDITKITPSGDLPENFAEIMEGQ